MTESWHSAKRPGNLRREGAWRARRPVGGAARRGRHMDDDDPHIIGQRW
jgi:hypothetical protein